MIHRQCVLSHNLTESISLTSKKKDDEILELNDGATLTNLIKDLKKNK